MMVQFEIPWIDKHLMKADKHDKTMRTIVRMLIMVILIHHQEIHVNYKKKKKKTLKLFHLNKVNFSYFFH